MSITVDPEGAETRSLLEVADLDGRNVLEIGCGDGRFTWRYAERTRHVTAIDPAAEQIARARQQLPERLKGHVELHDISFEDFASSSAPSSFDIVILSWALC